MKTLRLTFAMGGGVSLGSFSGAALTEILKALVLDGRDHKGERYHSIVLDSMSGASAGAIALAILMRSLMDYKGAAASISEHYIVGTSRNKGSYELSKKLDKKQSTEAFLEIIKKSVDKVVEEKLASDEEKHMDATEVAKLKETLLAIEVSQILQEILWVKEASIQELLESDYTKEKLENFSLLPRGKIVELTNNYLIPGEVGVDLDNIQVLGERVIFACSLTNLLPNRIVENEEGIDLDLYPQIRETKKALSSKTHKELRVFDFKFKPDDLGDLDTTESNWLEFSPKTERDTHRSLKFNLKSKETWAKIAASVIACGAFPVAFSPVILKRWKAEFPQYATIPKNDKAKSSSRLFNSVWEVPGVVDHKLPYVDGGTFNNEPVREAFKLANYIDTNLRKNTDVESEETDFDRLVVFVDPIVDASELSYNMYSYSDLTASFKRGSLHKVSKQSAFMKMAGLSSQLIGMLHNQGAVKEEHKISDYLSRVRLKAKMFAHLSQLDIPLDNSREELELFAEIVRHVKKDLLRGAIPSGTRKIGTYLFWTAQSEFRKRWTEEDDHKNKQGDTKTKKTLQSKLFAQISSIHTSKIAELLGVEKRGEKKKSKVAKTEKKLTDKPFTALAEKLIQLTPDTTEFEPLFQEIFAEHTTYYEPLSKFIKLVFFNIAIDTALDLDGKDPKAIRLSVTPISYPASGKKDAKTITLPGAEMQAFSGFFSLASREYAFNYGRYCALQALKSNEVRSYYAALGSNPELDPDEMQHPFVSPESVKNSLESYHEILGDISDGSLTSKLKTDFDKLKKTKIMRPAMGRILSVFSRLKRDFFRACGMVLTFVIVFIIPIIYCSVKEWYVLRYVVIGLGFLLVALVIAYYFFKYKGKIKKSTYEQIDSYANFEIAVRFPELGKKQKKVKAVRFNKKGRYVNLHAGKNGYSGIKLFIRQTEYDGNNRRYHLFAYKRALRNWDLSPLNTYEQTLNENEKDSQRIHHIDLTTKSWLGRLRSFSHKPAGSIDLSQHPLDAEKIEQLKFFIDPAIFVKCEDEVCFFAEHKCLTQELENIILDINQDTPAVSR